MIPRSTRAFTLVELLVVIAIIGILAALLLPVFNSAMAHARRGNCISNVKQIDAAVMMYAADSRDTLFPFVKKPMGAQSVFNFKEWTAYVPLTGHYLGLKGTPSPLNRIFACPADTFHDAFPKSTTEWVNESLHSRADLNYSSYIFNAGNAVIQGYSLKAKYPGMYQGVLGSALASLRAPEKTILLGEWPAWAPYSWHSPSRPRQYEVNNAPNVLGFADGHVGYVRIYCGTNNPMNVQTPSFAFDPPSGYEYKWSGN